MNCASDLYKTFFNSVSDPIFVIDAATKTIVEANAQAVNYSGYRPEELKGLCIDRLFRSQDSLELSFFFQNDANKTYCDGLELLKKDGAPIAVNASATWVEWGSTKYLFIIAPAAIGLQIMATLPGKSQRTFPPSSAKARRFAMSAGASALWRKVRSPF